MFPKMFLSQRLAGILLGSTALLIFATGASAQESSSQRDESAKPLIPMPNGKFLPGGPLAGYELPVSPQNTGEGPEVELFPGSIEHWRSYMMKYMPVRSFFDVQSLLKRWVLADLPGIPKDRITPYASPVYQTPKNNLATPTGKFLDPVKVVRLSPGEPTIKLDLGQLPVGLYALRVIGAVPTEKLRPFRLPLVLRMTINDGPNGEISTYRIRAGYVDEFYNVGTFYFHALTPRKFTAECSVDPVSKVDLLAYEISLDDVLAGADRTALKTRRSLTLTDEEAEAAKTIAAQIKPEKIAPLTPEERLARDAALWNFLPPLNAAASRINIPMIAEGVRPGANGKSMKDLEAEFGVWEQPSDKAGALFNGSEQIFTRNPDFYGVLLVNKKLGLTYTMEDLKAGKPLPAPYPIQDNGIGIIEPDPSKPDGGQAFIPIAREIGARYRKAATSHAVLPWINTWKATGNPDYARDAAILLVRYAFQYPTIEVGNFLDTTTSIPQFQGRDQTCRAREGDADFLGHYADYVETVRNYDRLFDYIKGNEELAQSIGRFVPWVKNSQDVIKLLDVYLVQMTAKRILRYQYNTGPTEIAKLATALGGNSVTAHWIDWLYKRTWAYPLDIAGLPEIMISSCDREGVQYIGSTFYGQLEGASRIVDPVEQYIAFGGDKALSLSDPVKFPKSLAQAWWQLNTIVGGQDFPRIGDVTGPDKSPGATMTQYLDSSSRLGWELTADPRFAWTVVNVFGRKGESEAEWAKLQAAAAKQPRAPWLDLNSRHVDNWMSVLETGQQHDDYRFHRAAYLRTGVGIGHAQEDALDLQIVAHGLPMTINGGQRSGYSKPNDRFTRIHNTVEVDGRGNHEVGHGAYGWPISLSDAPGARYTRATVNPLPPGATLFQRQTALIDVDEGTGSEKLPTDQQKPNAKLPAGVTTANSYVVDFFRVSGGKLHTYCFHGPVEDDFQWNATDVKPVDHVKAVFDTETPAGYLSVFEEEKESKAMGIAPAELEATWRYLRGNDPKKPAIGSEEQMLGKNFDPASPRKFTRLTVFDTAGDQVLKAKISCIKEPIFYKFTDLMLQRRTKGSSLDSVFAAVIEPYAGEPFITSKRLLKIDDNDGVAKRAAAIEVETKNGRRDVTIADLQPAKTRTVQATGGTIRSAAEFAFASTDADGLRLATLTGGTLLETPTVRLAVPSAEFTGVIGKTDFYGMSFLTDTPIPQLCAGDLVEILAPGRPTAFTLASVKPDGKGSLLTTTRSGNIYRSETGEVTPEAKTIGIKASLPPTLESVAGLTLSNENGDKSWTVRSLNGGKIRVDGPITAADFEPANYLRLWEYGPGAKFRIATDAALNRVSPDTFAVSANTPFNLSLKGSRLETSDDGGKSWQPLNAAARDGWVEATVTEALLTKPLLVRVTR